MMTFEKSERGVSLIELLVAVAILAVGLTPLLSIFMHALKVSDRANKMTIANNLARDLLEEIRSQSFWDPEIANSPALANQYWPAIKNDTLTNVATPRNHQPVGLEVAGQKTPDGVDFPTRVIDVYAPGTPRINAFDDVDDYDGWCRGANCVECKTAVNGLTRGGICADGRPLEAFDGRRYDGAVNSDGSILPDYRGLFTRSVRVFNIFPNVDEIAPVSIQVGYEADGATRSEKNFKFFDLRDVTFPSLTSSPQYGTARGRTGLKVIRVEVEYTGNVGPHFTVVDQSLAVLQASE